MSNEKNYNCCENNQINNPPEKIENVSNSEKSYGKLIIDKNNNPTTNKKYYHNWLDNKRYAKKRFIDSISACGVIVYSVDPETGKLVFLFQKLKNPKSKKYFGLCDKGGKRIGRENLFVTAAREFCEETGCMFYFKEKNKKYQYNIMKGAGVDYNEKIADLFMCEINSAVNYYVNKLRNNPKYIIAGYKHRYITYFLHVPYIPVEDLPKSEDPHIIFPDDDFDRERELFWVNYNDLVNKEIYEFHGRLRAANIIDKIKEHFITGTFDDIGTVSI